MQTTWLEEKLRKYKLPMLRKIPLKIKKRRSMKLSNTIVSEMPTMEVYMGTGAGHQHHDGSREQARERSIAICGRGEADGKMEFSTAKMHTISGTL